MARKTKKVPTTETRNLPICTECNRAFEPRDVETLDRDPELTLTDRINRIYTKYSSLSGDGGTDRDFEDAVEIDSSVSLTICHYCLEDVYDHEVPEKRPLEDAREAANRVIDEELENASVNDGELQ